VRCLDYFPKVVREAFETLKSVGLHRDHGEAYALANGKYLILTSPYGWPDDWNLLETTWELPNHEFFRGEWQVYQGIYDRCMTTYYRIVEPTYKVNRPRRLKRLGK